jgi:prepilin-type N-terminal cleavage/methylation domain-containing protein
MSAVHPSTESREAGFTMIELLVASLLFVIVFTIVGGIFFSLLRTQQTVNVVTGSANSGQLAANSIENGIRNSSDFQLSAVGSDQLIVARTAGSGTTLTWGCTAWYYSAAGSGEIRSTRTTGAAIDAPTSAELADWTLVLEGVEPHTGSTIFTVSGPQLTVSFDASAGDHSSTAIDFTVIPLTGATGATTCY